ncbi:MAG TPA: SIS domain-containing protein [Bryobacteraceae bacterium]|nr:SIS domain-containing protein [Bryobacteraceae bacterium]
MSLMLDEIREQPAVLEAALREEMSTARALCSRFEKERPRFVVLAARGTSDNAAQFGRYLIEIATGIPVSLAAPSVFTLYRAELDFREVLYVGLSQSGESTDVNTCIQRARELGAITLGVTNDPDSTLARTAEQSMFLHAGRESSVAATKTWVAQLLSMYLLAWSLGADLTLEQIRRMPDWAAAALELEPALRARAERYVFAEKAIVVGRGFNYSNALEFALKLMETCYLMADSFSSADFLHGPIAIAERGIPAFAFAPPGPTWTGISETLARLTAAGVAPPLVITDERNREACALEPAIAVPAAEPHDPALPIDALTPIPYAIPAQLLAAHIAEHKGLDPDRPRMLQKVTQTL